MWELLKIAFAPPGEGGVPGDLSDPGTPVEPAEPVLEDSAVEPEPAVPSEPLPAPTVPLDVFQKRIAALTKQREDLQRQLAAQTTAPVTPTPTAPAPDLHAEAMALATQMRLNERADAIARAGQAQAPDFMTRVATLNATFGTMSPQFIEAVAEAGGDESTAAKILYELGGDIGKASEIMTMSPTKQAVALARLSTKVTPAPAPPRPQAPAPITPRVGGAGRTTSATPDLADPKTDINDWMAQRQATAKGRRR